MSRPELTSNLLPEVFKAFYWDKKELVAFCSKHKLTTSGGKLEITARIENFLATGKVAETPSNKKRTRKYDSDDTISLSSKVVNFKCDAKTREFFIKQIGEHFKFNDYLRQFAKVIDLDDGLTYGDLVKGWVQIEAEKKNSKHKPQISKQFQFNQFQRDYYNAQKNSNREAMLDAWKLVRSIAGPATYAHYVKLLEQK